MPIQINTSQSINDINQDLKKQTKTNKEITPKFFHKRLTGSSSTTRGFFTKKRYKLKDMNKHIKLLESDLSYPINVFTSYGNNNQMNDMLTQQRVSFFKQPTNCTHQLLKANKRIPCMILAPVLFETPYKHYELTKVQDQTNLKSPHHMRIPKDAYTFGLNNPSSWSRILPEIQDKLIHVKPIIQDVWSVKALRADYSGKMEEIKNMLVNTHILCKIEDKNSTSNHFTYKNDYRSTDKEDILTCLPNMVDEDLQYVTKGVFKHLFPDVPNDAIEKAIETIRNLDVYAALTQQAKNINDNINELIIEAVDNVIHADKDKTNASSQIKEEDITLNNQLSTERTKQLIQIIDTYNSYIQEKINPETFSRIRQIIQKRGLTYDQTRTLLNGSLRLLLSEKLDKLQDMKKNNLFHPFNPSSKRVIEQMNKNPNFSRKQKRIIQTTNPLVIGQAGAGVGKSHTIVGRLNYMKDQYINLNHVLVSSFTNVAADTIKTRFPEVRSETLSKVFSAFYKNLYPNQIISNPVTFNNSLKIINPNSSYFNKTNKTPEEIEEIIVKLQKINIQLYEKNVTTKTRDVQGYMRRLTNLIESNIDVVELILNACRQTTFEIQPILLHYYLTHRPEKIIKPKEYEDIRFIITDESQDLSTFEYIILLEFVNYYKAQLLVVGDGSQTLYEFRNSNPEYMNSLEASGIFETHKLDQNYRSNNDILLFANEFLDHIDSNRYAKINLKSNILGDATVQSFKENVQYKEISVEKSNVRHLNVGITKALESKDIQQWIINKLNKNEQVAILAHYKSQIKVAENNLRDILDQYNIKVEIYSNTKEDKLLNTTISETLSSETIQNDIQKLNVTHPHFKDHLKALFAKAIHDIMDNKSKQRQQYEITMLEDSVDEQTGKPKWAHLLQEVKNNQIPNSQAIGWLKSELIHKEAIMNQQNDDHNKLLDEDIIKKQIFLSTIHSAKGLEFDNTLVIINEPMMTNHKQEHLRMYFVALSRGKKSEYIINLTNRPIYDGYQSSNGEQPEQYKSENMYSKPIPTAWWHALSKIN